jgi:hypothetical protein
VTTPKFTPGPWNVVELDTSCDEFKFTSYAVCDEQNNVIVDALNSAVATIETEGPDEDGHVDRWDEQGRWNAHAISALPDLYEALEMVRDADEDCKRDGRPSMPPMPRAKVDAALAKARGETP